MLIKNSKRNYIMYILNENRFKINEDFFKNDNNNVYILVKKE